jgi:hypothetical protein
MSGTLQGYIKGSSRVEAIASYIFEKDGGLLAMMGCTSTEFHVALARKSLAPEEVSPCDSDAASSDEEELLQSSSAEEEPERARTCSCKQQETSFVRVTHCAPHPLASS